MSKTLAVCGILIEDGKILTVSRKDNHNMIGLVGGKVENNETLIQAIKRECLEETGYYTKVMTSAERPMIFVDDIGDFKVYCFMLEKCRDEVKELSPEETGLVQFVDKERLLYSSPFIEYNIKALRFFDLLEYDFGDMLDSYHNERFEFSGSSVSRVNSLIERFNFNTLDLKVMTSDDAYLLVDYFTQMAETFDTYKDFRRIHETVSVCELGALWDDYSSHRFIEVDTINEYLNTMMNYYEELKRVG